MNRIAAPQWLRAEILRAKRGDNISLIEETRSLVTRHGLTTVCESARCPNRGECYSHRTATFMILGNVCTRRCTFCAVDHGLPQGPPDEDEPRRLACAACELGLDHVVVTSVTRDDLDDGGSVHFADTVGALRSLSPNMKVELLVPDFKGSEDALGTVLAATPDILGHNIETVPRLYRHVRPGAVYSRSVALLRRAKELAPDVITKSGLMLGLGETSGEIVSLLRDLAAAGVDMLTVGQYLAPSPVHAAVRRYVSPEEFGHWREFALGLGFRSVASGPLVRSSYKASHFFEETA